MKEIECPYCNSSIVPKEQFSSGNLILLAVLGVLPSIFSTIGFAILWNPLSVFFDYLRLTPVSVPASDQALWNSFLAIPGGVLVLALGGIIFTLVLGMIPAIMYWIIKKDKYGCPLCEITF